MNSLRSIFGITWRSLFVATGYFLGMILTGMVCALLGAQVPAGTSNSNAMVWFFIASIVMGFILCPIAMRLSLTYRQHFILWLGVIFFNMGSVAIEGKYFVPDLVPLPLSVLFVQQLFASTGAALVITLTCAKRVQPISWLAALRTRPWFVWLWRFLLSASSYLVFYYIFGSLNYSLITRPYYESHAGGLTTPAPEVVLMAELVRAPLIVLSILLFLLSVRGTKRELMLRAGWVLFAIGGIVPVILQIGSLPFLLLVASAVEIFCQNFLTGMVSGSLLGLEKS
jgi:hypothetical protein